MLGVISMVTRELNVKSYTAFNYFFKSHFKSLLKLSAGKSCLIDEHEKPSSHLAKERAAMTTFPMRPQVHHTGTKHSQGCSATGFMATSWGHGATRNRDPVSDTGPAL